MAKSCNHRRKVGMCECRKEVPTYYKRGANRVSRDGCKNCAGKPAERMLKDKVWHPGLKRIISVKCADEHDASHYTKAPP